MKRFLKFACTLTLSAVLAACSGGEDSSTTNSPNPDAGAAPSATASSDVDTTLRINLGAEPKTLDPAIVEDIGSNKAVHALMEGLVWSDKDLKPLPGVAKSWEHNDNYTLWTFHLREDAKWHNGDPVVAGDFKFAAERVCSPGTAAPYVDLVKNYLKGGGEFYAGGGLDKGLSLDSVQAIDDHTLSYETPFPTPFFLTMITFGPWLPVHPATVKKYGAEWSLKPETYMGNGPFQMTEYRSRDRAILEKSDNYWDKTHIFWNEIQFYMIEEDNTEDAAFRTGDLDVTESVAVSQIPYWREKPEFRSYPGLYDYYISFNTQRAPFDNAEVRKAFSTAIDRKLIVDRVARGQGEVSEGFVPFAMPSAQEGKKDFRDAAGDVIPHYDPKEAAAILAKAGFRGGKGLASVEYSYNTGDLHKVIAEQLQQMWGDAFGIDVQIKNSEWGVLLSKIRFGDFQACRSSWVADFADPINFLEIFETGYTKNAPKFSNAKYDELIEKARIETDPVKREKFFIEAEKILVQDECAIAPIYNSRIYFLAQTDIEGLDSNALANMTYIHAHRVAK